MVRGGCLVYDCGSRARDGSPRALWYGLEFIRYTLTRAWLRQTPTAWLRGRNVTRMFESHVRAFRQSTARRLQYYAKFLPLSTNEDGTPGPPALPYGVRLYGAYRPTPHDDDAAYYVRLLHSHALPSTQHAQQPSRPESLPLGFPRSMPGTPRSLSGDGGGSSSSSSSSSSSRPHDRSDSPDSSSSSADGGGGSGPDTEARDLNNSNGPSRALGPTLPAAGEAASAHIAAEVETMEAGISLPGQAAAHPEAVPVAVACDAGGVVRSSQGDVGLERLSERSTGLEGDGALVLARFGFRLFRRGLSPVEWVAAQAASGASASSSAGSCVDRAEVGDDAVGEASAATSPADVLAAVPGPSP
ncbi:hypothetical protein TSOC_010822 [Tetrabaena socialis]|uniref:Uncharacterized protein n=1 Tax=Tetrabaena socialis TaxID=47790 RepID=A0A2J7ZSA1_9CHLO|nr:hypothetical protein TSOC_010822 [Tetrabaena socialis]|eukprot:PNH03146.1 hypothetical protein TSOC_010822 [Tetrabaena socialis]